MGRKKIEFEILYDPDWQPTCSVGCGKSETCPFYAQTNLGTREVCMYPQDGGFGIELRRRGERGLGYLIPTDNCPMHTR